MATKTSPLEGTSSIVIEPWNVILLNDDFHSMEEVMVQLVRAIACTVEVAEAIMWEAHSKGEAVCFTGPRERCELVASILEEIELRVRLEKA